MIETGYKPPTREMHPSPVFTDALLRSIMDTEPSLNRELLHSAALSGTPSHSLAVCLDSYTKEHLLDLASDHEVDLPMSARKKQFVDSLSGRIVDRFPKMLPYLPVVNLEFLKRFKDDTSIVVDTDMLQFRDISHVHNFGFLYLYKTGASYTAVVPRELLPALQMLKDTELWKSVELHQRLDAYAVSLSNLYGVLDIDQFAIVWNRFEAENLTPAMAQDELDELGKVQYYWWFEDELVISSFFRTLEEVEQFLDNVKQVSYYAPSREELVQYFQTPYDDQSPAASAMMEFLSGYRLPNDEQIEDLMDEISDTCIAGDGMQDVFDLLNEYGLLFTGMDEITRFTELYVQMSENCRKWALRGHTPNALKKHNRTR
jgi:hypothetical protein